jgi:hypothetical protein
MVSSYWLAHFHLMKKSAKVQLYFGSGCGMMKVFTCEPRVHAQTIYYQENLAFCFQLCTVAHFVGYLPLPWFSCTLVFFPYR